MPHLIALARPLTTGTALGPWAPLHLAFLVLLGLVPFLLARQRLRARMFD
jgi:hypothetical protein